VVHRNRNREGDEVHDGTLEGQIDSTKESNPGALGRGIDALNNSEAATKNLIQSSLPGVARISEVRFRTEGHKEVAHRSLTSAIHGASAGLLQHRMEVASSMAFGGNLARSRQFSQGREFEP
jgi:hypothetical protein